VDAGCRAPGLSMKKITNVKKDKSVKALTAISRSIVIAITVTIAAIAFLPPLIAAALEEVKVSREITAPIDKVWNVVSNIDNETKYWPTFKVIKNINDTNSSIEREVVIATQFGDIKRVEFVTVDPDQFQVQANITEGPWTGTRLLTLNPSGSNSTTLANVVWQMDLSGIPAIGQGFAKDGIEQTTVEALGNIAEEVERK
jgi:carbon monoxide dehydrogenase subunit G